VYREGHGERRLRVGLAKPVVSHSAQTDMKKPRNGGGGGASWVPLGEGTGIGGGPTDPYVHLSIIKIVFSYSEDK
jgi:hypothetical protein